MNAHFDQFIATAAISAQPTPTPSISAAPIPASVPPMNVPPPRSPDKMANPAVPSVTMSGAATKVLAGEGHSPKWEYRGVVKWNGVATDAFPLTNQEIMARSDKTARARGKGGNGRAPAKGARFLDLRERWICLNCSSLCHEKVGATSNLLKLERKHALPQDSHR
ncbi:unnamed protein product [Tilletia controversa]|nr:unnamed protein product [Tilletia controversa]CAD6986467.1 unnamed protein product [Tilletia controversa]